MNKIALLAVAVFAAATPAHAGLTAQTETGFVSTQGAEVLAKPDEVWKRLLAVKEWWNPQHSWSGKTDGFYIDAQAGGCFCELIQDKGADGEVKVTGSVEHMRVIHVDKNKVLRMQGALGPLQSEAVLGTLTVVLTPLKDGSGTKVIFEYVVGGYMRYKTSEIAPAVDGVIGEQFQRMIKPLGKLVAGEAKATDKPDEWSLPPGALEEKKPDDKAKAPAAKPEAKPEAKPADKAKSEKVDAAAKPATDKPKPAPAKGDE